MDAERADLYWKWGARAGLALLLLLANALLVTLIVNVSGAFDAMDRVGETAESLRQTSDAIDVLAAELEADVERITDTLEQAGQDATRARAVLERAGEDITRATDTLEEAGIDLDRAANDFGRIADALEEAFAQ